MKVSRAEDLGEHASGMREARSPRSGLPKDSKKCNVKRVGPLPLECFGRAARPGQS